MKLENLKVQEMSQNELVNVDGGWTPTWDIFVNHLEALGENLVDAGQWTLGVLAGIGDGITEGLND